MKFRKRNISPTWIPDYVHTALKRGHTFTIYFNDKKYFFWLEVTKDKKIVYNSLKKKKTFKTLEKTESFAEEWSGKYVNNKINRRPKLSLQKKFKLLVNAINLTFDTHPEYEGISELKKLSNTLFPH